MRYEYEGQREFHLSKSNYVASLNIKEKQAIT
jgi:hypothetical protein